MKVDQASKRRYARARTRRCGYPVRQVVAMLKETNRVLRHMARPVGGSPLWARF